MISTPKDSKRIRPRPLDQQCINQLIKDRKFQQLITLFREKCPDRIKSFTKLQFMGFTLQVGGCVMMQENEFNSENFAASIKSIVCMEDLCGKSVPLVEVQWYGSREDVYVPEKYLPCISDNELFLSTQIDYRPIDCIKRPIKVLTFHQYETLEWEEEYVFFSRAGYNHQTYEVSPVFAKWTKACLCRLPVNPDEKYVLCDRCYEWYHQKCVKYQEDTINKFLCPKCR